MGVHNTPVKTRETLKAGYIWRGKVSRCHYDVIKLFDVMMIICKMMSLHRKITAFLAVFNRSHRS